MWQLILIYLQTTGPTLATHTRIISVIKHIHVTTYVTAIFVNICLSNQHSRRLFSFWIWLFSTCKICSTCAAGTVYLSGAPELSPSFCWGGSSCSILSFLWSVLQIIASPFSFGHWIVCPYSIYGYSMNASLLSSIFSLQIV